MDATEPDRLAIRATTADGVHVLVLDGELDYLTAAQFAAAFQELPLDGAVELDLANVPFCDSAGLSALLEARRMVVEGGGTLRLRAVDPQLSRTLQLSGLTVLFR